MNVSSSAILGKNKTSIKPQIILISLWFLIASLVPNALNALTQTPTWATGLDFGMPYRVSVDGDIDTTPENKNIGGHIKYFFDNNVAFGLRGYIDINSSNNHFRRWAIGPEITYQWFQSQTWMPYVRSSLPVVLRGAPNTLGSRSKKTLGFSTSFGLAWNLGQKMGVDRMLVTYDFGGTYYFKIKDSLKNFGLDLARFGVEVRF